MPEFNQIVESWQEASTGDNPSAAIHPSGASSEADYIASGQFAASQVAQLAPPEEFPNIGDFGCGDGRVAEWVMDYPYENVVGVDAAPGMLKAFEQRIDPETLITTPPILTLLEWDGSDHHELKHGLADALEDVALLDAWYSLAVFIHHSYADGAVMLANMAATIRPGGRILLEVPVYDHERERTQWNDVTVWTAGQLLAACETAGLTVTEGWFNEGTFSYENVGPYHGRFHVLDKPAS